MNFIRFILASTETAPAAFFTLWEAVVSLVCWEPLWPPATGRFFFFTPVAGYGFAWVGHFFFEKNRPATFKHPFYSFMGDWVMMKDIILGRLPMFGDLGPNPSAG